MAAGDGAAGGRRLYYRQLLHVFLFLPQRRRYHRQNMSCCAVNTIIDYFGNSEMCLGIVTRLQNERMQVRGATNQITHVTVKQVLCQYGECTANNPLPQLVQIQNQISELQSAIDLEFLWSDLVENPQITALEDITAEYYGSDATSFQRSAMARALIADSLRFQRKSNDFTARSADEIEQLTLLRQQRAQRAALKERIRLWLIKVIAAPAEACSQKPLEIPEEMRPFIRQISEYLLNGFNCDAVNLLATAPSKLSPRELGVQILRKTASLPEGADEYLLSNGIHAGFAPDVLEAAAQIPVCTDNTREDLSHLECFSIDDQWTREIDDALSCEFHSDGSCTVGIHLATLVPFVRKGDLLDNVAAERPLSLYLPTTTVMMFPEALGCGAASLNAGELRPALSCIVDFDGNGDIADWRFSLSQIRVAHRLTYIEADAILERHETGSLGRALARLAHLSVLRQTDREEAGAVSLNRPEIKIRVENGEINLYPEQQNTASHRLVQEFMVLANHLAARFCLRNDVPIIYRCQEMPTDGVHSVVSYDPVDFDLQVRKMKRTRLSTYPDPHCGLGLDLYTQISSPLRRYADMVIQRQMAATLSGAPLPYTQQELFGVLDNVERVAARNRALERDSHKRWMLEYLRRNCRGKALSAIVVRVEGNLVLAELTDCYERGVVLTRDRPYIGDRMEVRINEVRPELGRLVLEPA